jgi:two-component system sensor histidine kinase BaeS
MTGRPAVGEGWAALGLGTRLFAAMALVVCAGAGTLLVVALLVAPPVFGTHLRRSRMSDLTPAVQTHVDRAFTEAVLISLTAGIVVAVLAAGLIAWLVARRLAAPVAELATATTRLADGNYDTYLADPRLGPEFTALTTAVNQLAGKLAASEQTRRRLLADLGHELRTPIAALEATVEAITDGVLPVDTETLDTLGDQASRLRRLVVDLESVSRAEERQLALQLHTVRLTDLIRRAVTALRPHFRAADVTLLVHADDPGPTAIVDQDRLVEALMNLLDNAVRHTPPGGTVTVTVEPLTGARKKPGDHPDAVQIVVADTGEGFPPEQAALLFARFYRTDSARSNTDKAVAGRAPGRHGSGIGLTITRAIIDAHHGIITAASGGPGRGATFTITLPVATDR